jgi:hypothetical protein
MQMEIPMSQIQCPYCHAALPSQELASGWCETCGKRIPEYDLMAAKSSGGTGGSYVATAAPAKTKLTVGQWFMILLVVAAVLVVVGSAAAGDPKSIRVLGRIGGMFVGCLIIAGIGALFRRR